MPGRKKIIKSTEIIEDKDESLIAHLPIKLENQDENNNVNNDEIETLKNQNSTLIQRITQLENQNATLTTQIDNILNRLTQLEHL